MGLWEDAAQQAEATQNADTEFKAKQESELREFVEAMGKLGIRSQQFLLYGWLSLDDEPTQLLPTGDVIEGWAIATFSKSAILGSDEAPFVTAHTVVTTDLQVFETGDQLVQRSGFLGMKVKSVLRPMRPPIRDVPISAQKRVDLSEALRDALAAAITKSRKS